MVGLRCTFYGYWGRVQPNSEKQRPKFYSKQKQLDYRLKMDPRNKMEIGWFLTIRAANTKMASNTSRTEQPGNNGGIRDKILGQREYKGN